MPNAIEAPRDRIESKIPLVRPIRWAGADNCAAATKYVNDHPKPRPIKIG